MTRDKFFVVGMGASAGGLEPIKDFFSNLNTDKEVSFVVVIHSSPNFKSKLPEIFDRVTQLNTKEIEHDMEIEPHHIYFLQAGTEYSIKDGKFVMGEVVERNKLDHPVDRMFFELSENYEDCSIGIILSGTGSDGALGMRAIREKGGFILVEDPEVAQFNNMPTNSLALTAADFVGTPAEMAKKLEDYIETTAHVTIDGNKIDFPNEPFNELLVELHVAVNVDFSQYKKPTLQRRITRRMAIHGITDLNDYVELIKKDKDEPHALMKDFLIGVTRFFRDPHAFDVIRKEVIPDIARKKKKNVKCWVTACSTGEEAYTMAILWAEYCHKHDLDIAVKIFATDIDNDHINIASAGIYPNSIENNISQKRLSAFFIKMGSFYKVKPELRSMLIFSRHNITTDPPFHQMDLISCRNLLIYMKPQAQKKIITRIHYSLNSGGYLMLGPNEYLGHSTENFSTTNRRWKIYKNTSPVKSFWPEEFEVSDISKLAQNRIGNYLVPKKQQEQKMTEALNDLLLEEFSLACLFIDKQNKILNAQGDYTKYLQLPGKKFSLNLMKMLSIDLSNILTSAIRKVTKEKKEVSYRDVKYRDKDSSKMVDVVVRPMEQLGIEDDSICMIVLYEKNEQNIGPQDAQKFDMDKSAHEHIQALEEELDLTKNYLQTTVEEMESANEELQSSNEEILAANEELQSTNEELQSVNEELHTVNIEHQEKIDQLAQLHDDIDNLLKSTKIGTLFLDMDLKIRKFTPTITTHFNLIDTDIGRPISHISSNITNIDSITSDIKKVIKDFNTIEREVKLKDGEWHLMRILPYITKENIIKGAVVTFVNIDELKKTTEHLHETEQRWTSLVNNASQVINIINKENKITFSNSPIGTKGHNISKGADYLNFFKQYEQKKVVEKIDHVYQNEASVTFEVDAITGFFEIILVPYKINEDIVGLISIANNINDRIEASKNLQESEERFRKMADNSPVMIWMTDENNQLIYFNKAWTEFTGRSVEEALGEGFLKQVYLQDRKKFADHFAEGQKENKKIDFEFRLMNKGGKNCFMRAIGVPRYSETDDFKGFIGSIIDIDENKMMDVKKDEFLNIASHELRTPLSIIKSYTQLVLTEDGDLNDKHLNYLKKVNNEINVMNGLIMDLLDISRIQSGKLEIRKTGFDVNALVEETIENLSSQLDIKRIALESHTSTQVKADKNRISQVLNNLLTNAYKFSPQDTMIKVIVEEEKENVRIKVIDKGKGIEKEMKDKIFNRYFQVEQGEAGGIGLGLFICKDIIDRHGGQLGVKSEKGKGSEFYFTLPKK